MEALARELDGERPIIDETLPQEVGSVVASAGNLAGNINGKLNDWVGQSGDTAADWLAGGKGAPIVLMRNLRKNGKAAQGAYHSGEDRAYLDVGMLETPRLARRLLIHEAIGHRLENLLPGYATAMTQSQHYNHFQLMLKGYFNSDELEHERKAHGWAGYFEEVLQYGAIGYLHD